MKSWKPISASRRLAFTLIELLVVIAVIAVLAALIFPIAAIAKRNAAIKRVQTQMKAIESAIDTYKANVKVYPPENPISPSSSVHPAPERNTLYYELVGTRIANGRFESLGGLGAVTEAELKNFLGLAGNVDFGFVNLTRGSDDELQAAKNCIPNIKPTQYLDIDSGANVMVLGVNDVGELMFTNMINSRTINPWRYTSRRATNNVGGYDLWVDVTISGKNYRICNWNDKYILLP